MKAALLLTTLLYCSFTQADTWLSFTLDNDIFAGRDQGYTNGLYLSHHRTGANSEYTEAPKPSLLTRALSWSLPKIESVFTVDSHTLGQIMITPKDITRRIPDPNDLPYSGTVSLTNTFIAAQGNLADKISVTIGVIGPLCRAAEAQIWLHQQTHSTIPQGWDSQLENEIIFQLERARIWRKWLKQDGSRRSDMVFIGEVSTGLIKTLVSTSALLRWGSKLKYSYVTSAFSSTRTSNPIATEGRWFIYGGLKASYIAHQVYMDGNTFRDSLSTDLDHTQLGATIGLTYSWSRLSLSLAMERLHLFEQRYENTSAYGTLTIAWKQS